MKKTFIGCAVSLLLFIAAISPAIADQARLVWEHEYQGSLNGYRIYIDDMDTPAGEASPLDREYVLPPLTVGQEYLFGVSAWNAAGESKKIMLRMTYQEDIVIEMPQQPVKITIKVE